MAIGQAGRSPSARSSGARSNTRARETRSSCGASTASAVRSAISSRPSPRSSKRGIGFRSLTESIDTTTPGGRLVFHVFAALAEFERDLIRERTQAGLSAARARGRLGGRPPVLSAEKLAVARSMYDSREHTTAKIAEVVGVSRATLYRHLGTARPVEASRSDGG